MIIWNNSKIFSIFSQNRGNKKDYKYHSIMAVYQKLGAERDPAKLAELAGFVMQNVKTNLSADTPFTLGLEIVQRGNIDIKKGRMPADNTWKYANKDGRSVLAVDLQENAQYLHKLMYDK